jgi:hypothetical protein
MIRYMTATGASYVLEGRIAELNVPLMFEPGDGSTYGIGMDWIGYLVQQVSGQSIDRFCRTEIFEPLGLKQLSFLRQEVADDLGQVFAREAAGDFVETEFAPLDEPELFGMGNALYGTAGDYLALLRLVVRDGELDGTRLLSPGTAALMKTNLMGEFRTPPIRSFDAAISEDVNLVSEVPTSHTATFSAPSATCPVGGRRVGQVSLTRLLDRPGTVDRRGLHDADASILRLAVRGRVRRLRARRLRLALPLRHSASSLDARRNRDRSARSIGSPPSWHTSWLWTLRRWRATMSASSTNGANAKRRGAHPLLIGLAVGLWIIYSATDRGIAASRAPHA